ncbi:sirohydrochlorin cobaltochelatase [Porphyromonadaceae bacterium W3.11]|nr:sirohydrochlorin cobaltochelatase [Porphyromonadaceae bacterium W3.11]
MELLYNHKELLEHLHNFHYEPLIKEDTPEDKCAIVIAHFGSTEKRARECAIEPLNDAVRTRYPKLEVREAYTSRIIMKRLRDRGMPKKSLPEVLHDLANEGYQAVLVQPSMVIDGVEIESIMRDIHEIRPLFKEIRISTPLLYHPIDFYALSDKLPNDFDGTIVYVGHGTYDSSTAQYCMLQHIMDKQGQDNVIISTIEGYPDLDDLKDRLAQKESKDVLLRPLMFVAGIHAREDISEDWYEALTEEGYKVTVETLGLGERPAVRELYLNKIDFSMNYKAWDIQEKKKIYRSTGEKL